MTQTRLGSFLEAWANTLTGFALSVLAGLVIYPAFGLHTTLATNVGITACFTGVSIARGYVVRRLFNRIRRFQHAAH